MSSFIVEDSCINGVVCYLIHTRNIHTAVNRILEIDISMPHFHKELGERMFALNVEAVEQRYGKGRESDFRPLNYKFLNRMPPSPVQVYKSLQCFLYQCAEGNVPEMPLYEALVKIRSLIAENIVDSSPGYESAVWGGVESNAIPLSSLMSSPDTRGPVRNFRVKLPAAAIIAAAQETAHKDKPETAQEAVERASKAFAENQAKNKKTLDAKWDGDAPF